MSYFNFIVGIISVFYRKFIKIFKNFQKKTVFKQKLLQKLKKLFC